MIRKCLETDFEKIYEIINDGAKQYRGAIPIDCYNEPYMSKDELKFEIKEGVEFWGCEADGNLVGVMGIQNVQGISLIRHAYIKRNKQNKGIGSELLSTFSEMTDNPILVGTWADAKWAVTFYEKNGFRLTSKKEKNLLLRQYWSIPQRQIENSVVLIKERRR
jgi:N-acetylglutamate synthase-like GNAT family acetyltransferase